jgi:hypothetical protein
LTAEGRAKGEGNSEVGSQSIVGHDRIGADLRSPEGAASNHDRWNSMPRGIRAVSHAI